MVKNVVFSAVVISFFALTALSKMTDEFKMTAKIKTEIEKQISAAYENVDFKQYLSESKYTYTKQGDGFRFIIKGKMTKEQKAIDRCEGDLAPEGDDWKVELDFCNF